MGNKLNRNFGKMVNGRLVFAPFSLIAGNRKIFGPKSETYKNNGWLPIVWTEKPTIESNQYATYSFEEKDGSYVQVWTIKDKVVKESLADRVAKLEAENIEMKSQIEEILKRLRK